MTTVLKKASPHPRAANLKLLLLIMTCAEYSNSKVRSSDVISSIVAVAASQRLMSENERGKFILRQP